MRKPSFGVTTTAIVVLCLIGGFKVLYEPLLPPSPTEYLITLPSTETLPAPIVEIDWKRSIEEGRQEAKRRKLGMLIFFVDPSNYYAKQLELDDFRDPEVARFVNRSFVPVKINLDQYPEWSQTVLPLQRLGRYIEPGIELLVTDSDGHLIDHFPVENPFQFSGPEALLPFFISCQRELGQGSREQSLQLQQKADFQALITAAVEPLPAFSDFNQTLKSEFKFASPGVFVGGSTKFRPMALRTLAKTGDYRLAAQIARELAITPLYDAIDGGFYREARTTPSSSTIDTSKSSAHNALSAVVVAQLACADVDAGLSLLAMDIGNEVCTEFSQGDGLCASRLNDSGIDFRSRRSSLSTSRMQSILNPQEITLLQSFVTTDRSSNQDLASLLSLDCLGNRDFVKFRQILKERLDVPPSLSEPDHIATVGYVAARLFDLYRYTGDTRFLNRALGLAKEVYSAFSGSSIARVYGNRQLGPGWLGTYLSFADCGLANFAATGEINPLRQGQLALQIAIKTFRDPETGLLFNTHPGADDGFAFSSAAPDLADRGRESMNAQAIRLAHHYSVLSEDRAEAVALASLAQNMLVRLNSITHKATSVAAGYFDAAFDTVENKSVMVSGPDRVDEANALARKFPFVPIYPLVLSNGDKKTGFYLREGDILKGPFSLPELQKLLVDAGLVYTN